MNMTTTIQSLQLFHQGKVRDTYVVDDEYFLMVTSDRISAFDVIMNEAVESKERFYLGFQISGSQNRIYYQESFN